MPSLDRILARVTRFVRTRFARPWRQLVDRWGRPPDDTALGTLDFLLSDYSDPPPVEKVELYGLISGASKFQKSTRELPARVGLPATRIDFLVPQDYQGGPAVILSPGFGAHSNANRYLEEHLASKGYLVVRPTHKGSNFRAVTLKTPLGAFTPGEFTRRVAQVQRAVLGLLDGEFLDQEFIGPLALGGHSFGALTTAVVCGLEAPGIVPRFRDKVSCLLALSPYGDSFPYRRLGIAPQGFAQLSLPTLFISGTRDEMFTLGKGALTHLEPFYHSASRDKIHVLIKGTRHGHFSEFFGRVHPRTRRLVSSTTLAFLDAHLRVEEAARGYLNSQLTQAALQEESWVFR